jgi:hypothetical protein
LGRKIKIDNGEAQELNRFLMLVGERLTKGLGVQLGKPLLVDRGDRPTLAVSLDWQSKQTTVFVQILIAKVLEGNHPVL